MKGAKHNDEHLQKESLTKSDIKRVCDILRRDDGVGAKDYIEQFSWLLFLKVFEGVEGQLKELEEAEGRKYRRIIDNDYEWSSWAKKDWKDKDELINFINQKLFPYLKTLKGSREKDKIGEIFRELPGNRIRSPHNLLDVIGILDKIEKRHFQDTHLLSQVYEEILQAMGTEGGWSGEFYTPRPIIRLMVKIANPKLGEKVFDPFVGSGGFLVESFNHIYENSSKDVNAWRTLQTKTFFGQEKKPLPFLIGTMNLILHHILVPNLMRTNTFNEDVHNVPESSKMDVILTNPPFGAEENANIQNNFPIPVSATDALALQYVMKKLKAGGRCAIVLPESDVVFGTGKYMEVRKTLLETNSLYAVIALPKGVFKQVGADVKTYLLFFEKTGPTKQTWYYELDGNFSRTRIITDEDLLAPFESFQKMVTADNSWFVTIQELSDRGYNLRAINPHKKNQSHVEPKQLLVDIQSTISSLQLNAEKIGRNLGSEKNGEIVEFELSDILKRNKAPITISDSDIYKRVTIQMHGKGVRVRDEVKGSKIGTKRQFIIKNGQLLISKIDARNGAYGIVPTDCNNAIITGNFWAYDINTELVDPKYFSFVLRSSDFLDFFEKASQGATNRRYLQEKLFLNEKIRLPLRKVQEELLEELDICSLIKGSAHDLTALTTGLELAIANRK